MWTAEALATDLLPFTSLSFCTTWVSPLAEIWSPPSATFPPGQTAPVVFSTPQATQMNTPSQPRQVRGCGKGSRGPGWEPCKA